MPLECLVTIERVGEGGADRISEAEVEVLILVSLIAVLERTGFDSSSSPAIATSESSSTTLGNGVNVFSPTSLPVPTIIEVEIKKRN